MNDHKKIFSDILEELNISDLTKSSLLEKIDQVNIETYGEYSYSDRAVLLNVLLKKNGKKM